MRGESVTTTPSAGDAIATGSRAIEVRVAELRQLFNAIDPSPFRERDLDPNAEQFIVDWARDLPRDAPLALRGAPRTLCSARRTKPHCWNKRFTSISKRAQLLHDEHSASCSVEVASAC